MKLRVATRKSKLALAQTRAFVRELVAANSAVAAEGGAREPLDLDLDLEIEEVHITTTGDRIQDRALSEIGGKGLFLKEIEEALLEGAADFAVHSMKDVPAELASGLELGCVPPRADPRDVFITASGCSFADLPAGSRVGTSSLRRSVQLGAARPDLEFVPFRGNVDTRLRKLEEGVADATLLARCGLVRLGVWDDVRAETLAPEMCLPAVGQGALAIEIRSGDAVVADCFTPLRHEETELRVAAERGVMGAVNGSCQVPVAAFALREGEKLWLRGFLAETDGTRPRSAESWSPWPRDLAAARLVGEALGKRLAAAD
jgi:hydroxymethylbilane synthase